MNLLREPLLHFALGGALLFAGYAGLEREQTDASGLEPVRISEGEIRWLKETWANQWRMWRVDRPADIAGSPLAAQDIRAELVL
ncbi:hypothetical protein SAMN05216228_104127 [Rhizobium tibeticum]|uniref:Uncharacterized protein n=1 Tax=Rhizobium tibeticum TaxID=501024 RepID=A0A1H8VCA6_9HYPH|nr:hypothetical protein [Rhizobium tibeticum]SEI18730.1 hypothetical protein RTCCBAU85039_5983 [Rhizobium tibeticum]SEP13065.1 hypothetical protein SAMN05216228_104127 [Rhizobium tibeticum]